MKFKNTFHVFVDNFSVTYKHLVYRLVIIIIATGLYAAIIYPFINGLTGSAEFIALTDGIKEFFTNLVEGRSAELGETTEKIKEAFSNLLEYISQKKANIIWGIIGLVAIHFVEKFFTGLGNYALAAVINDKMALHAESPYLITLVRNLKEAALYNIIYTPLSIVYDIICYVGLYFIMFKLLFFFYMPLRIFLYATAVVAAVSVKMTFTTDWLPAIIRGKMGQKQAFLYTFDRNKKQTFNVLSNYVVLILIIFAVNVGAIVFTFGAAGLLTIPSSYIVLVSFEFVNYYDREELKYFIDKKTIVKPEKEHSLSREEFFRGE